ncbi:MAG: hypothetical protein ABIJ95_07925 [Pseudomonadota bacterium]
MKPEKQVMVAQRMLDDMDALGAPYSVGPDGKTFHIQLSGFPVRAKKAGHGSSLARTPGAAPAPVRSHQAAAPAPCQATARPQGQESGLVADAKRRAEAYRLARERAGYAPAGKPGAAPGPVRSPQAAAPAPCQAVPTSQGQESGLVADAKRRAEAFRLARERAEASRAAHGRPGSRTGNPHQAR